MIGDPEVWPSFLDAMLDPALPLVDFDQNWSATLIGAAYTYSAAHVELGDVIGLIGDPVEVTGLAVSGGVVTADEPVFDPPSGYTVRGVILFTAADDRLIAYYGRRTDGRLVNIVTTGEPFTMRLRAGRLLRY